MSSDPTAPAKCLETLCMAPRDPEAPAKDVVAAACGMEVGQDDGQETYVYRAGGAFADADGRRYDDVRHAFEEGTRVSVPDAAYVYRPMEEESVAPHSCLLSSRGDNTRCIFGADDSPLESAAIGNSPNFRDNGATCPHGVRALDYAFVAEPGSHLPTAVAGDVFLQTMAGRKILIVSDSVGRGMWSDLVCRYSRYAKAVARMGDHGPFSQYALASCVVFEHDVIICDTWFNFNLQDAYKAAAAGLDLTEWYSPTNGSLLLDPESELVQKAIAAAKAPVGKDDVVIMGGSPFFEPARWVIYGVRSYTWLADFVFGRVMGNSVVGEGEDGGARHDPYPANPATPNGDDGEVPMVVVFEPIAQGFPSAKGAQKTGDFSIRGCFGCEGPEAHGVPAVLFHEVMVQKAIEYGVLPQDVAGSEADRSRWAEIAKAPQSIRSQLGDNDVYASLGRSELVRQALGAIFVPTQQHLLGVRDRDHPFRAFDNDCTHICQNGLVAGYVNILVRHMLHIVVGGPRD